jgi:hypothetical protein
MRNMLSGILLAGAALVSGMAAGANDNLDVKIQTVDGKDTTIRAIFEAKPDLEFLMIDAGNWACTYCRKFADTLQTHKGWLKVFSTDKCTYISVIQDNVKAWGNKYGNEHTYKGNIMGTVNAVAPNNSYSEFPIMLFVDRSGKVLAGIDRATDQDFVDVVEASCN